MMSLTKLYGHDIHINVLHEIVSYDNHSYFHKFGQNIKMFKILCTKYMVSGEVMTSSTHSFAYSYRCFQKCFMKMCETSKYHNFLNLQPIFIKFSLFCSICFTLSSEIKLSLFWIYPLIKYWAFILPRQSC